LSVYLDTCVLVPIFLLDPFNARVRKFLASGVEMLVSDFASAEFASVVGIRVRTKLLTAADGRTAFATFDTWVHTTAVEVETQSADVRIAEASLRRLDMTLRTGDALNLAIALRTGAELATFDKRMAECARKLGISVAKL
jgi:predicted nucleic acid-binding protein